MNKREHLITESLGDGNGANFARAAAAHIRRRRATKQAGLAASLGGALAAAFVLTGGPETPDPTGPIASAPAATPILEILSDQELLALFKDQPVLVLKDETGITGVILLKDHTSSSL
jgi:alpha-beta hydrolase superfamily lysophospholipase